MSPKTIVKKFSNIFANFNPIEKCILIQAILEKKGYQYFIVHGYLNTDIDDMPMCCSYVWLESSQSEDKIYPIKNPFEKSFTSTSILSGITCIDKYEPSIMANIEDTMKNSDKLKKKHRKLLEDK
jgi:hypothetical protein